MGVARSLVPGDELRHAPPGWLEGLAWGAWLVLGSLATFTLMPFALPRLPQLPRGVVDGASLLAAAALTSGAWLLTRPHPRFSMTPAAVRWAARVAAVALPLHVAIVTLWDLTGRLRFRAATEVLPFAFAAFPVLLFLHLRHLALRVLNPRLAEHCQIVGTGASAALLVLLVSSYAPDSLDRSYTWAYAAAFVVSAALLFLLWGVLSLLRFALALARAWRLSREAWDAADASAVVPAPPVRSGI
jgi:hypothetical protein